MKKSASHSDQSALNHTRKMYRHWNKHFLDDYLSFQLSSSIKLFLCLVLITNTKAIVWEQKGCHIVGHTQKIDIPGCIIFKLTSNACRGYCVSYAIPSNKEMIQYNSKQLITSIGNCCAMTETEVMNVRVLCRDGPKNIKFKSATKCGCFHCKKS
ncbi:Lysosomal-trafficking regulator [Sarcoptes scabiei]|nr:Lysosomal-trafficking regulator [Sarcoptes scabiei]